MDYAMLGRSGLIVSRLAFGAMTFTAGARSVPSINKVEQSLADRMVGAAIDAGITFFDTADIYDMGQSEQVLGRALKAKRKDVVIATKVGWRTGDALTDTGLSRRHVMLSVDDSLKRLGTDWIDVYIAHRPDKFTPLDEIAEGFDAVVRSGKVRYIALSNWPAWKAAAILERQASRGLARFTHAQMHYSLLGRDLEVEIMPMLEEYGLGLSCWSPLSSGFLSGKYTRERLSDPETRFGARFGVALEEDQAFALLDELRVVADQHDASLSQVSLAWLLAKKHVSTIILGVSNLDQLQDNLGSTDIHLSQDELERLGRITEPRRPYPHVYDNMWHDQAMIEALAPSGE